VLNLSGTPITGDALRAIEGNENLVSLNLYGTRVGDRAVQTISRCSSLIELNLNRTSVSESRTDQRPDAGQEEPAKQATPLGSCRVHRFSARPRRTIHPYRLQPVSVNFRRLGPAFDGSFKVHARGTPHNIKACDPGVDARRPASASIGCAERRE